MKRAHTLSILIIFNIFLLVQNVFGQFDIPKKPKFQTSVYDYINLLSDQEKNSLENKLIKYSDTTSTQIVISIIDTTKGENISYLATNWAHKWGIGDSKKDNGVFILLANKDRKINIQAGYGVEHLLTDFRSRQIIEIDILPYFKKGNYYQGLNSGVDTIFKTLNGEYKGTRKEGFDPSLIIFIVIIIFFLIVISRNNKNNTGNYTDIDSRDLFDTIILSNTGRGTFSSGSGGGMFGGSSGGFGGGGFGGGGFGGGGATGGW